jgi:excisionase family DNA binding protein
MTGRLLTGRQVADQLGISTKTVLRWALEGELPSIRLSNRAIRFRPDQLEQWLDQRATPAQGAVENPAGRHPLAIVDGVENPNHKEQ